MTDDTPKRPERPKRLPIPPFHPPAPHSADDLARAMAAHERGQRMEEEARKLDEQAAKERPERPVINVDDDPHNANWLRILAQRRRQENDPSGEK